VLRELTGREHLAAHLFVDRASFSSMARYIPALAVSLMWVGTPSSCSTSPKSSSPVVTLTSIVDVNVIDVRAGTEKPHMNVVIAGDRIAAVGPLSAIQVPARATVIDGRGRFLIPGLWDMHIHVGTDIRGLRLLLAAGITGVRDMGGDPVKLLEMRHQLQSGTLAGPRLIVAGPMLAGPPSEASDDTWIIRTPEQAHESVASLVDRGVDFIKVHDHLTRGVYTAIANSAQAKGVPFAGHVSEFMSPAEASDMGQRSIEHLEFLPKPCMALFDLHTNSIPAGCDQENLNSLLQRIAKNRTWLDPTIGSFVYFAPKQWTTILSKFRDLAVLIRNNRVEILAGTDQSGYLESKGAIPGQSLHDEMAFLVDAGFTPAAVLRSATSNAADYLGLSNSGTIEVEKTADLALLDGDPLKEIHNTKRIAIVIKQGRVYDRMALAYLRDATH
jgi:imidazolonepropionase-like amidohydrolase